MYIYNIYLYDPILPGSFDSRALFSQGPVSPESFVSRILYSQGQHVLGGSVFPCTFVFRALFFQSLCSLGPVFSGHYISRILFASRVLFSQGPTFIGLFVSMLPGSFLSSTLFFQGPPLPGPDINIVLCSKGSCVHQGSTFPIFLELYVSRVLCL